MCFTSAAVNGLFLLSPSDAVEPAFDAKAISVFGLLGSTLARPRPIGARTDGSLHRLGEGIVAAGIEDHQPKLLGRLDRYQNPIQREGFVVDIEVLLQRSVDRDQVVGAIHLSVTRIHSHEGFTARELCWPAGKSIPKLEHRIGSDRVEVITVDKACQALPNDVKERIERGKRSIGRVTHRSIPVFGTRTLEFSRHRGYRRSC